MKLLKIYFGYCIGPPGFPGILLLQEKRIMVSKLIIEMIIFLKNIFFIKIFSTKQQL
jgi:hypothetical protein